MHSIERRFRLSLATLTRVEQDSLVQLSRWARKLLEMLDGEGDAPTPDDRRVFVCQDVSVTISDLRVLASLLDHDPDPYDKKGSP